MIDEYEYECLQTRENRRKETENEKMMVNKHKSSVKTSDFLNFILKSMFRVFLSPFMYEEGNESVSS